MKLELSWKEFRKIHKSQFSF